MKKYLIKKARKYHLTFLFSLFSLLFCNCVRREEAISLPDNTNLNRTEVYFPGDPVFQERLEFLAGKWSLANGGENYQVATWNSVKESAKVLFPGMKADTPATYNDRLIPGKGDYILIYDFGFGLSYMGLVRGIAIFNNDKNRGAIIIEYFEESEPLWLSETQGLKRGKKPFFGVYYQVITTEDIKMVNVIDLEGMSEGREYYTEKATLEEALAFYTTENEERLIFWGVVIQMKREK